MKLIQLRTEQFKRVEAVCLDVGDDGLIIGGNNKQGKSSCGVDAIVTALCGASGIDPEPIRTGHDKAKIELTIDDDEGGQIIVTRTLTRVVNKETGEESTRPTLTVKDGKGRSYNSPQKMLDAMWGKVAFNPGEFADMPPAKQRETLAVIAGVKDEIDKLDRLREDAYAERTAVNRELKKSEAQLAGMTRHTDAPEKEVSVSELVSELDGANRVVLKKATIESDAKSLASQVVYAHQQIECHEAGIKELLAKIEGEKEFIASSEKEIEQLEAQASKITVPDIEAIRERMNGAEAANRKWRENEHYDLVKSHVDGFSKESTEWSESIADIDKKKVKLVTSAKLPIDGLTIADDCVLFGGLPLKQASSAEQLVVSVAIGAAMNPTLRLLLIKNGGLMDDTLLAEVCKFSKENGYQPIIEVVGEREACTVVIEDGAVKARGHDEN